MDKVKVKIFPKQGTALQGRDAMEEQINTFIEENEIEVIDIKFAGTRNFVLVLLMYK
jgi:hypothetical protein